MTAPVAVDHAKALESLGQADWHLAKSFILLIPVCHSALYVKDADPEAVMVALREAIRETQALLAQFTEASKS